MDTINSLYKTWNDFLIRWPVSAVEAMTLDEYTGLDDKETFTYWLEHRLIEYGSIRGGSAYKFGVFRKADTSKKHPTKSYKSDEKYAWHEKFGTTSGAAFANVKKHILDIITAVKSNALSSIESCPLAHTLKWKVAFHYQDQQSPSILGVFNLEALQTHLEKKLSMAEALKVISNELTYENIITKTDDIWNEWADLKSINIWKMSHGKNDISDDDSSWLDDNNYISLHKSTLKGQVEAFSSNFKIDDYVFIVRTDLVKGIVKVTSDIVTDDQCPLDDDWILRSYEVLYWDKEPKSYTSNYKKGWTPNYRSTFKKVATAELPKFESELLQPFFYVGLAQLIKEGDNMTLDYEQPQTNTSKELPINQSAKNTILYGPPGTGKTYHTVEAAVKAAEPNFIYSTRKDLKVEYERLVGEKRIRFVTFHQSYGYEEFVQGLRANSEEGNISYDVEDGIFKKISDDARPYRIARKSQENSFEDCWNVFLESNIDKFEAEAEIKITTKKSFYHITGLSDKSIYFKKSNGMSDHSLSINTLKKYFYEPYLSKTGLSVYYRPLVEHIKALLPNTTEKDIPRKNFVLIIDEINRGNISKIFGELITLIEPSKREGESEVIAVDLPLSPEDKPFSVPNNLYLIGTMNTADRSLAMMDTALRRRFDFIEMMPKPELFSDVTVKGIDLQQLIKKMNERIGVLYDREHKLGHAFFLPVKEYYDDGNEAAAWQTLQSIFQNKILPLLEEYFFEDWEKIRLVLGDNQKHKEKNQFVIKEELENKELESLFGIKYKDDNYLQSTARYRLNKTAFSNEYAYKYIIDGEPAVQSAETLEE